MDRQEDETALEDIKGRNYRIFLLGVVIRKKRIMFDSQVTSPRAIHYNF